MPNDETDADGNVTTNTYDEAGDLVLASATPKGFEEKARAKVLEAGRYATMPTIAGKKMYLRDRKNVLCLDLAGK